MGISTVWMGSINPRSASQRRIVPLKTAPGALPDARLQHVLQAARNPALCLSGALAFGFGIFWPLRLRARKASADFINSLHSYKWLCRLADGPEPRRSPRAMSKNASGQKPLASLLGMTSPLAEVFKNPVIGSAGHLRGVLSLLSGVPLHVIIPGAGARTMATGHPRRRRYAERHRTFAVSPRQMRKCSEPPHRA